MLLEQVYQSFNHFLGLEAELLTVWHMALRGLIIFFLGILVVKINRRFIRQRTEFNFILFIMMGSLLATAITGNAPFFVVLGAVIILLFLNWFLAKITFYFPFIEKMLKGKPLLLIKNGEFQWAIMKRCSITPDDLRMSLRLRHSSNHIEIVESAYMEPNGEISFVLKNR